MTSANNTSSGAFGQGTIANGYAEFVMGMMNKELPVLDDYEESPGYYVINPMESVFQVGNGDPFLGIRSNAITTRKNGETTLSNKYWVATTPTSISTSPVSSGGKALVVEGHTELKGNTLLQGDVTIAQPQGDISMGIYQ